MVKLMKRKPVGDLVLKASMTAADALAFLPRGIGKDLGERLGEHPLMKQHLGERAKSVGKWTGAFGAYAVQTVAAGLLGSLVADTLGAALFYISAIGTPPAVAYKEHEEYKVRNS